jgi:putative transposase
MEIPQRKSLTELNKIYFWTATIHKWYPLLESDKNKELIIGYLKKLSDEGLITVYAFVIMPTHLHLIWQQNALNGKETAKGSFLKYTAHSFLNSLKVTGESSLYEVNAANKKHEIWQRDSLGIEIYSRSVAKQKLDYIHFNPVSSKWQLAKDDISYYYSSAKFYEAGVDEFDFLHNLYHVFDGS